MMEKKRSVGVTIFAWLFIIGGIIGLLRFGLGLASSSKVDSGLDKQLPAGTCPVVYKDFTYYLYNLLSLIGLIGGIFLLKLKKWSRTLILALCCISLVLTVAQFMKYMKQKDAMKDMFATGWQTAYEQKRQEIIEKYKPEQQEKALEEQSKAMEIAKKVLPTVIHLIYYSVVICVILWNLGAIFFLTRTKVKEQFKEG